MRLHASPAGVRASIAADKLFFRSCGAHTGFRFCTTGGFSASRLRSFLSSCGLTLFGGGRLALLSDSFADTLFCSSCAGCFLELPDFSFQSRFRSLSVFHFSARKFPFAGQFALRSPGDQHPSISLNNSGYDIGHDWLFIQPQSPLPIQFKAGSANIFGLFPMIANPALSHKQADTHWRDNHAPLALHLGDPASVVQAVSVEACDYYNLGFDDLLISRRGHLNIPRNVAIYLFRNLRGDDLNSIKDAFKIKTYSTVSSIVQKTAHLKSKNRKISKDLQFIKSMIVKLPTS